MVDRTAVGGGELDIGAIRAAVALSPDWMDEAA